MATGLILSDMWRAGYGIERRIVQLPNGRPSMRYFITRADREVDQPEDGYVENDDAERAVIALL